MDFIKKYLETLKVPTQKLACLYAYIGSDVTDDDKIQLSVHGSCMMGELSLMTKELISADIVVHEVFSGLSTSHQRIRPRYYGEVIRFAIEEHPEWLEEFDGWPLTRYTDMDQLQQSLRRCYTRKSPQLVMLANHIPPYLIGLAHVRCYEPMISMIRDVDFPTFLTKCLQKWIKEDYNDPNETLRRQLSLRKWDDNDPEIRQMKSLINYYTYIVLGKYNPPTGVRITYYDQLTKGVHAMAQGKSDLAIKIFADALKADGVAALYWVVALWTSEQKDKETKLTQFVAHAKTSTWNHISAAVLLAETLLSPLHHLDLNAVSSILDPISPTDKYYVMQQKLVQLVAAFFSGVAIDENTFSPNAAILRHLSISYIPLNKFENKQLLNAFGTRPLLSYIKIQEPWELMLERVIEAETKHKDNFTEGEHRIIYIILTDGESVELREQNKLKDGCWGNGKTLPLARFISGAEHFMDRTDQAVVGDMRFSQMKKLTVGLILPHLVGSDRVYTEEQMPYRRVTIEQQTPYVILEKTKDGFHLQSNVHYQDLFLQHSVYHRDDSMHYTYYNMDAHARDILRELLSVTDYPLAAEEKLHELLPLISNTIEIHSSFFKEGNTLNNLQPHANIIIRLTPDPTSQTMFDAYLLVRPLQGGKMTLPPTQGDNVIIDYNETSGRVRIERNLQAEKENLNTFLSFCQEHSIEFSTSFNAHISVQDVLEILNFANKHQENYNVEWPEGEKIKMHRAKNEDWHLCLTQKGNWFTIEGNVKLEDNSTLTAQALITAISNSHGNFITLKNGDYLWLSEKLRKQLYALESMTTTQNNQPVISTLQACLLAELVNGEINIEHQPELLAYKEKIEKASHEQIPQPQQLNATLRPYQLDGFQWMTRLLSWGAGVCLADDMGLGKTIQTISLLLHEAKNGPALIVAPTSVVNNWRNELKAFAPSLNPILLAETPNRVQLFDEARAGDVILVSYATMPPIHHLIAPKQWNVVCLDEAHLIKNRNTKSSAACMDLKANKRIILTGTPVQNHLGELWNLFQFINPGLLGTYEQFAHKYIYPIEDLHDEERQQQLQRIVSPFMLRRTKQAVAKDLPEKVEITLNVELSNDEMAYYELLRQQAEEKFKEEGSQVNVSTLSELTKLRRTACTPELTNPEWGAASSKVNVFMELLQNIIESGNSVLVFSQFTSFLDIIKKELYKNNITYLYLDGNVPLKQRAALINDFQKGKEPVFLISLKAGGVGLNLTAANYVVHLDPWWNPAVEQQATDRAYRIGQQQAVTIYHLISHHTIEEKIIRLHEAKRNLADNLLEGADQNYKITSKDMLEILSNQWD